MVQVKLVLCVCEGWLLSCSGPKTSATVCSFGVASTAQSSSSKGLAGAAQSQLSDPEFKQAAILPATLVLKEDGDAMAMRGRVVCKQCDRFGSCVRACEPCGSVATVSCCYVLPADAQAM